MRLLVGVTRALWYPWAYNDRCWNPMGFVVPHCDGWATQLNRNRWPASQVKLQHIVVGVTYSSEAMGFPPGRAPRLCHPTWQQHTVGSWAQPEGMFLTCLPLLRPPGTLCKAKLQPDATMCDSQVFSFAVSYVSVTKLNDYQCEKWWWKC